MHFSLLLTVSLVSTTVYCLCPSYKPSIKFGVIFGQSKRDAWMRNTLYFAIQYLKKEVAMRNDSIFCRHDLTPVINMLPAVDSFQATTTICEMMEEGIISVLGPYHTRLTSDYVTSMGTMLQVPHIDLRPFSANDENRQQSDFQLSLHPSVDLLSQSIIDVMDYFKWQEVLIVYENGETLFRVESILRNRKETQALYFRIRRFVKTGVYILLKEMIEAGWTNVVLDLSLDSTAHFLRAAANKEMMNRNYHYILNNLDSLSLNLEDYRHNHVNMTAFRVVPGNQPYYDSVVSAMRDWQRGHALANPQSIEAMGMLTRSGHLTVATALVFDAVQVIVNSLSSLSLSRHIQVPLGTSCKNVYASNFQPFALRNSFGGSLMNYMQAVDIRTGLTGPLRFSHNFRNRDLVLDIFHMQQHGMSKFASWNSSVRKSWNSPDHLSVQYQPYDLAKVYPLKNRKLRVVAVATAPFIWVKREYANRYLENDKLRPGVEFDRNHLEGYCITMMEMIANKTGMDWTIYRSPNDTYGTCVPIESKDDREKCLREDPTSSCICQWNGIVNELINGRADIALGAFTITYERERAIDFTKPFMNLGISILFKKPKGEKPGLFSFLNPLAVEIWLYVVAAYLAVTMIIYALARFSPYEWVSPHPCDKNPVYLVNSFSLSNTFWFTVGTLMQQGSDINPRAVSTRIVGGIWWFFTLIIISSYTANLAAFLTVERMVSPIESAEDLAKQTAIQYGSLAGGSTEAFFDSSHIPTYSKMARYMRNNPHLKTRSSLEGIEKVKRGNYAFLMESAMIEYFVERDKECELTQVGGLIDSKGYGIGVRPNREALRDLLTLKILELQKDQELQSLKNKWWKDSGVCRGKDNKESKASALDMHNVGGIFLVLVCGLTIAVFVAIAEFVWNSRRNAVEDHHSLCSEMSKEFRFSLNCYGSSKKRRNVRTSTLEPRVVYDDRDDHDHINGRLHLMQPLQDRVFYKETVT